MQKTVLLQKKKVEVQLNAEEENISEYLEASLRDAKAGRVKKVKKMSDELRRHLEASLADAKAGRVVRVR